MEVSTPQNVKVEVFDVLGTNLGVAFEGWVDSTLTFDPDTLRAVWKHGDGRLVPVLLNYFDLPSGLYFRRVSGDIDTTTDKFVLLR